MLQKKYGPSTCRQCKDVEQDNDASDDDQFNVGYFACGLRVENKEIILKLLVMWLQYKLCTPLLLLQDAHPLP